MDQETRDLLDTIRHGTPEGYNKHRDLGLLEYATECGCRAAVAALRTEERKTPKGKARRKRETQRAAAIRRARARLAQLFPEEFDKLFREEMESV